MPPDRDAFMNPLFPVTTAELPPVAPAYVWEAIVQIPGLESLSGNHTLEAWPLQPTEDNLRDFEAALNAVKKAPQPNLHTAFLKADLLFALAHGGKEDLWRDVRSAYTEALEQFPDSPYQLHAAYHLGLVLMQAKKVEETVYLARHLEGSWLKDTVWASRFRSLMMESYYRRERYIRAEDYMWNIAMLINRADLSPHLALRYGDSLFWQAKYAEAVKWYREMTPFLEANRDRATRVSRLYYAESLFQTGDVAGARKQFENYDASPPAEVPSGIARYRLIQCALMEDKNLDKALQDYRALAVSEREGNKQLELASLVEWARLAAAKDDGALRAEALKVLMAPPSIPTLPLLDKKMFLAQAVLQWKNGNPDGALSAIQVMTPAHIVLFEPNPIEVSGGELAVQILQNAVKDYWAQSDLMGFLILADQLTQAIEIAPNKTPLLLWVGKAYIETGLVEAGAKVFQRILTELQPDPATRTLALLELSRALGLSGEDNLMKKVLALVTAEPRDAMSRKLYHAVRAGARLADTDYAGCVDEIQSILNAEVSGQEYFKFALQGAVCARFAGKPAEAEKFLTLLGVNHDIVSQLVGTSSTPPAIRYWQMRGVFEKVNLLAYTSREQEAVELFEKMEAEPELTPPLEALFSVVKAYRTLHDPDRASEIWAKYAALYTELPGDFKDQYTSLLDTLGKTEVLPLY